MCVRETFSYNSSKRNDATLAAAASPEVPKNPNETKIPPFESIAGTPLPTANMAAQTTVTTLRQSNRMDSNFEDSNSKKVHSGTNEKKGGNQWSHSASDGFREDQRNSQVHISPISRRKPYIKKRATKINFPQPLMTMAGLILTCGFLVQLVSDLIPHFKNLVGRRLAFRPDIWDGLF